MGAAPNEAALAGRRLNAAAYIAELFLPAIRSPTFILTTGVSARTNLMVRRAGRWCAAQLPCGFGWHSTDRHQEPRWGCGIP